MLIRLFLLFFVATFSSDVSFCAQAAQARRGQPHRRRRVPPVPPIVIVPVSPQERFQALSDHDKEIYRKVNGIEKLRELLFKWNRYGKFKNLNFTLNANGFHAEKEEVVVMSDEILEFVKELKNNQKHYTLWIDAGLAVIRDYRWGERGQVTEDWLLLTGLERRMNAIEQEMFR